MTVALHVARPHNCSMDHIYLDHNATTPTRPEVIEAMARCYVAGYANPASQHQPGQQARRVLEDARRRVAEILGADLDRHKPDRLVFTSGGTEANNLAMFGIVNRQRGADCQSAESAADWQSAPRPGRIIVSSIEHACVLEAAEHLLECGWRLDTLPVDRQCVVQPAALQALLAGHPLAGREPPKLVSVLLANHETGVVQPIEQLAAICRAAGVPLHTDAVAAAGKIPIDFRAWAWPR